MLESTRSIPPTAPSDAVDVGKTVIVPAKGKEEPILPLSSTPATGQAYSYHKPTSPKASIKKPSIIKRIVNVLKSFLMPVSMAVMIALPCALIPPLRALFTRTDGWTGTRMPNAPDGKPPLSFILETAAFIGAVCIPAGLILLGASFARLKVSWLSYDRSFYVCSLIGSLESEGSACWSYLRECSILQFVRIFTDIQAMAICKSTLNDQGNQSLLISSDHPTSDWCFLHQESDWHL